MAQHTEHYLAIIQKTSPATNHINSTNLQAMINRASLPDGLADGQSIYDTTADLLREINDAHAGIISTLSEDGSTWVRDATKAKPLNERLSPDHPLIEANNTLLRCLSRLRPVDFAIGKKHTGPEGDSLRKSMQKEFAKLAKEITDIAARQVYGDTEKAQLAEIKKLEAKFDTYLVNKLHEANLTRGCEDKKQAEKLLSYYRNLSSLMQPARNMQTLTYDKEAHVFQRETQYPVTKKTTTQQVAIDALEIINPYPSKEEKNAHNSHMAAMQEADSLFAELMGQDNRALPAQTRKTHLVGVKNAFIVKNELVQVEKLPEDTTTLQADKANTLWLGRTGIPVYVGKGESRESIELHTKENLEQIRATAQELMGKKGLPLHLTCLNTDVAQEHQDVMLKHLHAAIDSHPYDGLSYMPANIVGTMASLQVAPQLFHNDPEARPTGIAPFQRGKRLQDTSTVMLRAAEQDYISVVNCASGQDRTGTTMEKAAKQWTEACYRAMGLSTMTIERTRAEGGNAAAITTHLVDGSPGMKIESDPTSLSVDKAAFSKETVKALYLKSARTNKKSPVSGDLSFLQDANQPLAYQEYTTNLENLRLALKNFANDSDPIYQASLAVLKEIERVIPDPTAKAKPARLSFTESISIDDDTDMDALTDKSRLIPVSLPEPKQLAAINDLMRECAGLLKSPTTDGYASSAQRLTHIADNFDSKQTQNLKRLALGFAIVLAVAGACTAAFLTGGFLPLVVGILMIVLASAIAARSQEKSDLATAALNVGNAANAGFFSNNNQKEQPEDASCVLGDDKSTAPGSDL